MIYKQGCPHCMKAMPMWNSVSNSIETIDWRLVDKTKMKPADIHRIKLVTVPRFLIITEGGKVYTFGDSQTTKQDIHKAISKFC